MGSLSTFLTEELAARGWTVGAFTSKLGAKYAVVSRWMVDKSEGGVAPSPASCVAIARVLEIEPEELFRKVGYLPVPAVTHPRSSHYERIAARVRRFERLLLQVPEEDWMLVRLLVDGDMDRTAKLIDALIDMRQTRHPDSSTDNYSGTS